MKRCFIFAAGSFYGLRERPAPGDFVIAADAGYRICQRENLRPDILLGDFDSMEPPADFTHVRRLPVEKDDTDTLAAIRAGLEQGCGLFSIYGGTGGKRLDHTLANLQSLLFLRRRGARGFLWDDDFVWTVIENEALTVARTVEWGLFSAFCLGEHGDSSMIPFSAVTVGGVPFKELGLSREDILSQTHQAGMDIIEGKGSTEFGIGRALAELARCILRDEKRILPVSVLLEGEYGQTGIHCGVPCRIGRSGVEQVIQLKLTQEEKRQLDASCQIIKQHIDMAAAL